MVLPGNIHTIAGAAAFMFPRLTLASHLRAENCCIKGHFTVVQSFLSPQIAKDQSASWTTVQIPLEPDSSPF